MVQSQQMQNRGMKIMDADRMLHHAVPKVVVTQQLRQCSAEQAVAGAGKEIATCGGRR